LGRIPFRVAVDLVQAHFLRGEGEGVLPLTFVAPLQKSPAQDGEFLHADAIVANERKIRPNGEPRPRSILRDAFE